MMRLTPFGPLGFVKSAAFSPPDAPGFATASRYDPGAKIVHAPFADTGTGLPPTKWTNPDAMMAKVPEGTCRGSTGQMDDNGDGAMNEIDDGTTGQDVITDDGASTPPLA